MGLPDDDRLRHRRGVCGDIGQTAVFLAAPASDYINGAIINVDGGRFARQAVP
jgi:2-deoxy-D-gluconate 3-dehydrogenase